MTTKFTPAQLRQMADEGWVSPTAKAMLRQAAEDLERLCWIWSTRASISPELEGEWTVTIYDDHGNEERCFSGRNPREAIDTARNPKEQTK